MMDNMKIIKEEKWFTELKKICEENGIKEKWLIRFQDENVGRRWKMKKRREKKITPCYRLHPYGLPSLEKVDLKYCDLRIIQKYAIKPSIIRPTEKSGDRKNCMRNTYKKKYVRRLWKKKERACIRRFLYGMIKIVNL